jgi:hypothetical protein
MNPWFGVPIMGRRPASVLADVELGKRLKLAALTTLFISGLRDGHWLSRELR